MRTPPTRRRSQRGSARGHRKSSWPATGCGPNGLQRHASASSAWWRGGHHWRDEGAVVIAPAVAAVALTRGPVAESVTQRTAIVSFRTDAPAHAFVTLGNGARVDAGGGVDHVAKLERLKPGARYTYTVATGSGVLATGRFRAAPARAASFTFAVVGDFGSGNRNEAAVATLVESWHPDFVL